MHIAFHIRTIYHLHLMFSYSSIYSEESDKARSGSRIWSCPLDYLRFLSDEFQRGNENHARKTPVLC